MECKEPLGTVRIRVSVGDEWNTVWSTRAKAWLHRSGCLGASTTHIDLEPIDNRGWGPLDRLLRRGLNARGYRTSEGSYEILLPEELGAPFVIILESVPRGIPSWKRVYLKIARKKLLVFKY